MRKNLFLIKSHFKNEEIYVLCSNLEMFCWFFLKILKVLDSFKCPQYYYAGFALFLPNLDLNYFQMRLQIHYMYMKGQDI